MNQVTDTIVRLIDRNLSVALGQ